MKLNKHQPILKRFKEPKLWISNINLILFAFCTVFYARIFCTLTSAPSILTHAHFVVIPLVLLIILVTTGTKDSQQIKLIYSFLLALSLFFMAILASALWNKTGFVNGIVSFMMLGEPIMFLLAIVSIPMSSTSLTKVKKWLTWSVVINFLLAAVQKPLINMGLLYAEGFNGTDGCGGVFFVSGAGNYVSASVSLAFAAYFLVNEKKVALWVRITMLLAAFWQILFSDSKQLVFAYLAAWLLLVVFNSQDLGKTLKLLLSILIVGLTFYWCVQNLEMFSAYKSWARPELYQADGEAWYAKFYSVKAIIAEFQSPLDWLFGLGPGHTVSRLGAWFLNDYWSLLGSLGATKSSIGPDARIFIKNFWLTSGSSMFSPIFGWAGIWGDLGVLGLGAYLFLTYLVWQYFGLNNAIKIILLSILVLGFIFTQMEEPGYMLSIAMIIGLNWQETWIKKENTNYYYE